ncbi:MAG: DUF2318 domain-containing protein [Patescibacteria group bacterium]
MNFKYIMLFILLLLLAGCVDNGDTSQGQLSVNKEQSTSVSKNTDNQFAPPIEFTGNKGEKVVINNDEILLDSSKFENNLVKYYNTTLPDGKKAYFFVVKDSLGKYRAAANACQVCFDARMGFRQEGNFMVCNTCGNKYPLEKIATEKGGCNPGPINPNLEVENGNVVIRQSDLEQVVNLF